MAVISPVPKLQFFDANGNPLAGGKLYSYAAGTTTPQPTYTSAAGTTPNPNPVILDSRGEASVWVGTAVYKFKLTNANDVEIWTVDNVAGAVTLAQLAAPTAAAGIGFTPAQYISSTNVQGAITEIVTDLQAQPGASLIGFTPVNYLSSTDVQSAVTEVTADLATTSGAGYVGFSPTGPVTASTVQAAIAQVLSMVGYGSSYADLFSGDGIQTVFTLSNNPGNQNQLDVSVDGTTLRPGLDYTWTSGTTLTFTVAPPVGTDNVLVRYVQIVPVGTYNQTIQALLDAGNSVILNYAENTDFLFGIVDQVDRQLGVWATDGTYLAKLGIGIGVANGLTFTPDANMFYTLSLGTVEGEIPVGDSTIKGEYASDDYLWGVVDSSDRLMLSLGLDATLGVGNSAVQGAYANSDLLYAVTDANGRQLLVITNDGSVIGKITNPELIAARGSRATLNDRLSTYISAYGTPLEYIFNQNRLRRYRYLRRRRLLSESAQINIALIGDSYTHDTARYSNAVAETMIAELGDAGGGWVGFASWNGDVNGNVRPATYVLTRIGTWDQTNPTNYYTIPSPDLGQALSSTPGDRQSIAGPATPTLSAVRFFWNGTVDGVMQYRWNGGAWTTINVQGSGVQSALLSGLPVSGAWTLDMEVVSGTCKPCGVDLQSAASGVRVHKLAATGSRTQQWADVDATEWKASITSLDPQVVTIMLGTNDQFANRTPAQFKTDLTTMITRTREAMPSVDVAIMMPAENQYGNPIPMSSYAIAATEVAMEQNCAYLDTQYLFGEADDPDEYGFSGTIPLYSADLIHPTAATGGKVIADGVLRLFNNV